jgi:ferredoxin-NADP reductase
MRDTFDHSQKNGANVTTFYFKPAKPLRYEAGQFTELYLPHDKPDDRGIKRWFTLSSAPGDELLSITTRIADKSSSFKQALQALKPGTAVRLEEPLGDFVLPKDPNIPLVFMAGGIGITPFLSIARDLTKTHSIRDVELYYIVHDVADAHFEAELIAAGYKVSLIVGGGGEQLLEDANLVSGALYFISGPEGLAEKLVGELKASHITSSQIVTDYFPGY